MNYSREFIEDIIKTINEDVFERQFEYNNLSFSVSNMFNAGYCYYYAQMLKEIFPEAEVYNAQGHVAVKIGELFFDVDGCRVEDYKFPTQEQMSRIRQRQRELYRGYFYQGDDDLHSLWYKSENNSAERLRRFACEQWMIPDMLHAVEYVRNKYNLHVHEPETDSLFLKQEQVEGIIAGLKKVFSDTHPIWSESKLFALLLQSIMPKATIWSNESNYVARIGADCYNSNGFIGKANHNIIREEDAMNCGEETARFQFEDKLTLKGNTIHLLSAEDIQLLSDFKSNSSFSQSDESVDKKNI